MLESSETTGSRSLPLVDKHSSSSPTEKDSHTSSLGNDWVPHYVILFRSSSVDAPDAEEQLERLLRSLDKVGLKLECRYSGKGTAFVFVRCPESKLNDKISEARYVPF